MLVLPQANAGERHTRFEILLGIVIYVCMYVCIVSVTQTMYMYRSEGSHTGGGSFQDRELRSVAGSAGEIDSRVHAQAFSQPDRPYPAVGAGVVRRGAHDLTTIRNICIH